MSKDLEFFIGTFEFRTFGCGLLSGRRCGGRSWLGRYRRNSNFTGTRTDLLQITSHCLYIKDQISGASTRVIRAIVQAQVKPVANPRMRHLTASIGTNDLVNLKGQKE